MGFSFPNFVPSLDTKGWIGVIVGFVASFLVLMIVHVTTVDVRRSAKNSMLGSSKDHLNTSMEMEELYGSRDSWNQKVLDDERNIRSKRFCFIDCARGLAISFVTFFHYIWNLRFNDILGWEPKETDSHQFFSEVVEFWMFFGICFVILSEVFHASVHMGYVGFAFVTATCIMWHYWPAQASGVGIIMFCVGISSYVQNMDGIKWHKVISRIKKLFFVSICISIVTYIFLPDEFIYFGAIHCITVVSVLHLPFLRFPQYSILGSLGIFLYKALIGEFFLEVPVFRATADHMPWFENLGYLLFGIFCGHVGMHQATNYIRCMWGFLKPGIHLEDTVFPFLGRHSLFIFIVHQVVLFPLVKLATGNPLF
jgi:uncharacterized membrane protein